MTREQQRLERLKLFDRVYAQLPLQEQVDIDGMIASWTSRIPKMGPAMGKELFLAIALMVAEKHEAAEKLRQGKP